MTCCVGVLQGARAPARGWRQLAPDGCGQRGMVEESGGEGIC